ncbi:MAG: transglycosylase domain-containing protein, partial [Proteobacteria bacterium]|nr:transglycosylase domain-containing protein [Pseudomonadota bacterium]
AKNVDVDVEHKNASFHWNSSETRAVLKEGMIDFSSIGIPKAALTGIPVETSDIPQTTVEASLDIQKKIAGVSIRPDSKLNVKLDYKGQKIQAGFSMLGVVLSKENRRISVKGLEFSGYEKMPFDKTEIEGLEIELSSFTPSIESVKSIKLDSPHISFKLDRLMEEEAFASNPIIKSAREYWNQKAGAILGEAPNNSVRKEDIKKNKKVIRKNPLSKETLNAFRASFEKIQKKIMLLPAVDIQNGQVSISDGDARYDFNAISFNTAELFKDSQKFELAFNVREASAAFTLEYESDTPYPTMEFEVKNLASADFLNIINMPVPEKNAGTVSTKFVFSVDASRLNLKGNFSVADFSFFHQKVSPNVVENVNASAEFDATYLFADDKLTIKPISLTSGPITVAGFITISDVRSNPVIEFDLGGEDLNCSDIPKAIPTGFLPTITDLRLIGTTISPHISGKIPWKNPLISQLKETGFENKCYPVTVAPHFPELLNDDSYTFTTDYTYFKDAITVGPGTKDYTPLESIPPYVKAAMFLTEDKRFFDHGPLRIAFVERALRLNLNQRKYVYGGSTIGQQLTKNLFLNRSKNLARKLEEAFITWRMVKIVPKLRIFELYLNVIEFGPDIYGIYSASKFYFDKEPKDLTPLEGAFLASLKVSPSKGGRFYKSGFSQNGKWWHKRMKYIMKVLAENGYISVAEVIAANNWTPEFSYPTSPSDPRQQWLNKYGEYLQEQARKAKKEKKE